MGTGDYICVTMTGGAPWGFRLQGGKGYQEPLHVCKVRSMSKASNAGLYVGDEVISINGTNCTDIPYSEVVGLIEKSQESLQMLVKRTSSKTLAEENKNGDENINKEECIESTTLQIRTGPEPVSREHEISETNCQSFYSRMEGGIGEIKAEKDKEVILCHKITPKMIETPKGDTTVQVPATRKTEGRQGAMVELQLSLSQDRNLHSGGVPIVTLLGAETSSEAEHSVQRSDADASTCITKKETPIQKASTTFQITGKQQAKIIPVRDAQETTFPRVELILDCSGRENESRSLPAEGCVRSVEEGGHSVEPPSTVSFGITVEDSEQSEEDQQDHTRPNKHRARHARLRRSESLSEKQVKEAKSKCKSIALLLTAAPNPNSKGVLMFKKRRQRARKFTLTSYGTGELEQYRGEEDDNEEEEDNKENTFEVTFYGASESDLDEDFSSDPENSAHIVTFDWDTGLVEVGKKLNTTEAMEELPATKGKGVLMFAKRKQRMDEISAEQEEIRKQSIEEKASFTENVNNMISYQAQQEQQTIKTQSCVSKSYIEVSNSQHRVQNGIAGANESNSSFQSSLNRTARPFGGALNQTSVPFSPTRNIASPMSDVPAPPPYSSVTPPPEPRFQVSSPVPGKAQAAVWAPSYPTEHIASRDERIAVPASRTGILMEGKRRSAKPMFTFKEQPKVSPNPELLTLVQNREGKRGTGNESGPEEDYLSLGAEACNFMQAQIGKQKTPPPVAPKPAVKSPTTVMPTSPVWSPPAAAPAPQPFVVHNSFQGHSPAEAIVAPSNFHYNPPNTLNLSSPPRGPPKVSTDVNPTPKSKTPPTTPSGSAGPAYEMPALKGKGAELFARRQSRMEKFVVDSTTVQEKVARAISPTPSLPCSWKYSSNVRAPPPLAYNPIQSPLYPPAANKPGSKPASSAAKKKPTKTLSPLEVMKHQPYQLKSSLFTFQPPSASTSDIEAPKKTTKSYVPPPAKQAQSTKPVNAPYINAQPTPEYSQQVYNTQPSFQSSVFTPTSDCYPSAGYAMQPRQESPVATLIAPPRPKFSAKKAGVAAQEKDGRSMSFPARSFSSASSQPFGSPLSPTLFEPAPGYIGKSASTPETPGKRLTPWEAAAKSPLGFVDDAFLHESISANVVSAARRKTLPEPPAAWKSSSTLPSTNSANVYRSRPSISTLPKNVVSAPSLQCGYQLRYSCPSSHSMTNAGSLPLETRSEYCMSTGRNPNFNPYPRAWRS
ncbi:synaptopodin-2 isoform X2 [Hyla sarda]|uniref:synaptopodin-2 isoform X2 n=1 Tax=Hyla sarda TaxID=327740 RepID=UPI0024C436B2|nr:synaptopodin-2 isoform X2 [Hyla sarda]